MELIENYDSNKKGIKLKGAIHFLRTTDTEVLVNLLEEVKRKEGVKLVKPSNLL